MGIIIWIVFGALVGWVASRLMDTGGGVVWYVSVGILGAMLGGFIMSFLGQGNIRDFSLYSFLVSILGACVFIVILRAIKK